MLDLALQHYQEGRLAEAAACCGEILGSKPRDFQALHLLGRVRIGQGKFNEAAYVLAAALGSASATEADTAAALRDMATAELAQHHTEFAVDYCRRALAIQPNNAATLQTLGNALYEAGRFDDAIAVYRQGLAVAPHSAGILNNLGNALRAAGRLDEAVEAYREAVALRPDHALLHNNLGQAFCLLDRNQEAADCHRRASAIDPDDPETLIGLGNALRRMKQSDAAREQYEEEACEHYRHAVRLRPDDPAAISGLGGALLGLFRHVEAVPYLERAVAQRPADNDAHITLGNALLGANRNLEALQHYEFAEANGAASPGLRLNQALALLGIGRWSEGWEKLEARFSAPGAFPDLTLPKDTRFWRGENIEGKTILLQGEQGLGDTIHMVRYAPLVAERGAKVIVRVQPVLGKLIAEMLGVDTVLTGYEEAPEVDLVCPLMSLPLALGTEVETVPANVPYLSVPLLYRARWRTELGERTRPRIGLAWRGQQHLPFRSIPLATLAPLLQCQQFEYHSLQNQTTEADRAWLAANPLLIDHAADLRDFADTAAIADEMDLVISIDTAVAHLAGALARPLWVMLPFSSDFRWLIDREDCPWYPTARLFRQKRQGEWDSVVAEIVQQVGYRL
jgi:tetratricopeptide (TPR) repeat protein